MPNATPPTIAINPQKIAFNSVVIVNHTIKKLNLKTALTKIQVVSSIQKLGISHIYI